jgi:glycosyltransferase
MHADHSDAVYGDLVYVGRRNANRIVRYWRAGEYQPRAFHSGWVPPHPTFFCRRDLYHQFGGFDPTYRIAGDFELMLRLIEKHQIHVQYIPKPFVRMRAGGRANTLRGIIQGNREIIHAFHNNGMAFPSGFFCLKLFRKLRQFIWRPSTNLIS